MKFVIISGMVFLLVYLRRYMYSKIFSNSGFKGGGFIRARADVLAALIIFVGVNPYIMIAIFDLSTIDETLIAVLYCLIFVVAVSMFIAAIAEEWRALRKSRTAR